jgi:hypothetical protein
MESIYADIKIDDAVIRESLEALFPDLEVFKWDFVSEAPANFNSDNVHHIVFNTSIEETKIEFGFLIEIFRTPIKNGRERSIEIARKLAQRIDHRILVPYISSENPDYPYYVLIFDKGKTFLADDFDTNFADGTDSRIKVLGTRSAEEFEMDGKGNLIRRGNLT